MFFPLLFLSLLGGGGCFVFEVVFLFQVLLVRAKMSLISQL